MALVGGGEENIVVGGVNVLISFPVGYDTEASYCSRDNLGRGGVQSLG